VSIGALAAALGYVPSFLDLLLNVTPNRLFQTFCFNLSEAAFLLACVLFCAGVGRWIVFVDVVQACLFILLRFKLIYSAPDHYSSGHLLFTQIVALVLFLVAAVGCLGAASRDELRFLRILTCFFGIRLAVFFLANQVSYLWMHHENSSFWEVPGIVLLSSFAVVLFHLRAFQKDDYEEPQRVRHPSESVRSLMPSFLALVNLLLGLIVLPVSMPLAITTISLSVVFYVARTVLFHTETAQASAALQSRYDHLEGLVNSDSLTGLGNRRFLAAAYQEWQVGQNDRKLALILLDIDYFKQANDRHGHLYGDGILIGLARKLEMIASEIPGCCCARFGGDEFAVLLPGASSFDAAAFAHNLNRVFAEKGFQVAGRPVSLSIGIALLDSAADQVLEELVSQADQALYRAKLLGRNRVEIYSKQKSDSQENDSQQSATTLA
jgi:diguanylate cyclase (GGDEF)-like protein